MSLSSSPSSSSFQSLFTSASSRMRRQRRNAFSREADSDWDAPTPTPTATTTTDDDSSTTTTTAALPPWRIDQLICPLASACSALPYALVSLPSFPSADEDGDDLQAMLARFAFPSSPPAPALITRKRRRSGEAVDHSFSGAVGAGAGAGGNNNASGRDTGHVRRVPCSHCERGRDRE